MSARHCYNLGLFDQQVVGPVITGPKQFKRSEFLKLFEDPTDVTIAALYGE